MIPLFNTPLYCCQIEGVDIKKIVEHLCTQQYGRIPNEPGALTKSMQLLNDEELSEFKEAIMSHVNEYLKDLLSYYGEFYIHTSWGVMQSKGEKCTRHNHPNSLFSGIVYLQVSENSGESQFFHPHGGLLPPTIAPELEEVNVFNAPMWTLTPPTAGICLFPSYLEHSVTENKDDIDRMTVAFNIWYRGNLGNETSHLTLK